jgi:hypothetical protein
MVQCHLQVITRKSFGKVCSPGMDHWAGHRFVDTKIVVIWMDSGISKPFGIFLWVKKALPQLRDYVSARARREKKTV